MDDILKEQREQTEATESVAKNTAYNAYLQQQHIRLQVKTNELLKMNLQFMSKELVEQVKVIASLQHDQSPVLNSIKDYFKIKKQGFKDSIDPINMFRKAFGIEHGSGSLTDSILRGIERKREQKAEKKQFIEEYKTYNQKGIEDKATLGEKEANKNGEKLFKEVKKLQLELAKAQAQVQRGKDSFSGAPLQQDVNMVEKLQAKLEKLKNPVVVPEPEPNKEDNKRFHSKPTDTNAPFSMSYWKRDPYKNANKEGADKEASIESARVQGEQTEVLRRIEENTRGKDSKKEEKKDKKESKGFGDLFGSIFKLLPTSLIKPIMKFAGFIGKGIGKLFKFIPSLIRPLLSGIGFITKNLMKFGGVLMDALPAILRIAGPVAAVGAAGFAGYKAGEWLNTNVIDPGVQKLTGDKNASFGTAIYDFFNNKKDDTSDDEKVRKMLHKKPEPVDISTVKPTTTRVPALEVETRTAETRKQVAQATGSVVPVVNAPTTINKTSNTTVKAPSPKNQEPAFAKYIEGRALFL